MILYGDASALVKRYLVEVHSERVRAWVGLAERVASSRVAYVEVGRAVGISGAPDLRTRQARFDADWQLMWVIDCGPAVSETAARLAAEHRLRSLDAIHLASALSIRAADLYVATFDERLWRAARDVGLNTFPESWP